MKLFHIGDLHLGKRVYEFSMLEEQRELLEQVVAKIKEERPSVLLIAGDVYDKPVPPVEIMRSAPSSYAHLINSAEISCLSSGTSPLWITLKPASVSICTMAGPLLSTLVPAEHLSLTVITAAL